MSRVAGGELADNRQPIDFFFFEFRFQLGQFRTIRSFSLNTTMAHVTGHIIRLVIQWQIFRRHARAVHDNQTDRSQLILDNRIRRQGRRQDNAFQILDVFRLCDRFRRHHDAVQNVFLIRQNFRFADDFPAFHQDRIGMRTSNVDSKDHKHLLSTDV